MKAVNNLLTTFHLRLLFQIRLIVNTRENLQISLILIDELTLELLLADLKDIFLSKKSISHLMKNLIINHLHLT